jgi:hypothetical protein
LRNNENIDPITDSLIIVGDLNSQDIVGQGNLVQRLKNIHIRRNSVMTLFNPAKGLADSHTHVNSEGRRMTIDLTLCSKNLEKYKSGDMKFIGKASKSGASDHRPTVITFDFSSKEKQPESEQKRKRVFKK